MRIKFIVLCFSLPQNQISCNTNTVSKPEILNVQHEKKTKIALMIFLGFTICLHSIAFSGSNKIPANHGCDVYVSQSCLNRKKPPKVHISYKYLLPCNPLLLLSLFIYFFVALVNVNHVENPPNKTTKCRSVS